MKSAFFMFPMRPECMLIAFIGAHGTGKTTTCGALQKQLGKRQWPVFKEQYPKACHQPGLAKRNVSFLKEQHRDITITAITASVLGSLSQWSHDNSFNGLIDPGPPSILATHRYWMKICDRPVSPFLLNLYRQVASSIDYYVYLPFGVLHLEESNAKHYDLIFQKDIDQWILGNLNELNISGNRMIRPDSLTTEGRVREILNVIQPDIQKNPITK